MNSKRFRWWELALLMLPCAVLLLVGNFLAQHPPSPSPQSVITTAPIVPRAPTPASFSIHIKRFRLEPVNAQNRKLGADTCVTVQTNTYNAPPNVRWFYCRRLVAIKNGKTRALWSDAMTTDKDNPGVSFQTETVGNDVRADYHLFVLRKVPRQCGQLLFLWDAFAQPVGTSQTIDNATLVSLAELNRVAKWGGLRLSRKLVVRAGS